MQYWALFALSILFFVGMTAYFAWRIVRRHSMLQTLGYVYLDGDMVWTRRSSVKFPALCMFAGIAAGLLGEIDTCDCAHKCQGSVEAWSKDLCCSKWVFSPKSLPPPLRP